MLALVDQEGRDWRIHCRDEFVSKQDLHNLTEDSFAGTETTSNTLAAALYLLSVDHIRLQNLQAEVDEAVPGPDTYIGLSTARKLPYLDALLNESEFAYNLC